MPPSDLAEPDSDEALRATMSVLREALDCGDDAEAVLRDFARRVREHERLALRERPTQPDLGKVLPPLGDRGPKAY